MKSRMISLSRYDADEGKVFDYKPMMGETEEERKARGHLYGKTLFIGAYDSINNYIEIDESEMETEDETSEEVEDGNINQG